MRDKKCASVIFYEINEIIHIINYKREKSQKTKKCNKHRMKFTRLRSRVIHNYTYIYIFTA